MIWGCFCLSYSHFSDNYTIFLPPICFLKTNQLNEKVIKGQIKELVRGSIEETLNELLEAEAEKLTKAARYERNEQRQGFHC